MKTLEPCEKCLPIIRHHKAERDAMQSKRDAVLIALKMAEREHRLLRERIDVLENTQLQADQDCAKAEAERGALRAALLRCQAVAVGDADKVICLMNLGAVKGICKTALSDEPKGGA